jgi:hypothetical protein
MTKAFKAGKLVLAGVGTYAPATTDVSRAVSVMIE